MSIGIPVHNGERFLRESVDSVLAQDVDDFEVILCDNGSTDATPRICAEYVELDPRVRYHRSERNAGAAANFNQAFRLARGRFFRWNTHDDLVAPEHLRRCLEAFETGPPTMVLAYPKTLLIDESGEVIGPYEDRASCLSPHPHERLAQLLRHLHLCNPIAGLMRTEALASTGLVGSFRASDKVLLYELALRGEIVEVPERLFLRRRDASLDSPSNLDPDAQSRWFDPSSGSDPYFRLRLVRAGMHAIRDAPLGARQKLRCRMTMLREAARWRRVILGEVRRGLGLVRRRDGVDRATA